MSIGYQSDQGVATITIDRPEKKNAITGDMYDALVASLKQAADDKSVRAVLITGAGTAFTAGNDLKDFSNPRFIQPDSPVLGFMHALAAYEKPVVAAVNGLAVGIGVTMLLHCDLVVCRRQRDASRCRSRASGSCPEFASTLLLPRSPGACAPPKSCCSAVRFRRRRRSSWASRTRCCPRRSSCAHARKVAPAFNALPPGAVRDSKRLLRQAQGAAIQEAIQREASHFGRGSRAGRRARRSRRSWRSARPTSRSSAERAMIGRMATVTDAALRRLATRIASGCARRGFRSRRLSPAPAACSPKCLTDIAGSSDYFERGWVTYSNAAKHVRAWRRRSLIRRHGAVSEAVAFAMAAGALRRSRARVSIAVTGIAGPGGATSGKPVGTVWIAWGLRRRGVIEAYAVRFRFRGNRDAVRRQSVAAALEGLPAS